MKTESELRELEEKLEAFHPPGWSRLPELENSLWDVSPPDSYFGRQHAARPFQMFAAWRPSVDTVRRLATYHLCPEAFQKRALRAFRLCHSTPSAGHSEVLDPGERCFTYLPEKTLRGWNREYQRWVSTEWRKFHDEHIKPGTKPPAEPSAWCPNQGDDPAKRLSPHNPTKEESGHDRLCISEHTYLLERALKDPQWLEEVKDYLFPDTS